MSNKLNIKIKQLRNAKESPDSYPVPTNMISIDDFLTTYGEPINNKVIGKDDSLSYCDIKNSEDALSEDLTKVCMAYDDESDRGIVWVTEPERVHSYMKSVLNGSHIGIIGLIDLKSNIESFEELLKDIEWEDYLEEIQNEIDYWKSFYKDGNGHRYFVIVGKNRSLFAIPTIYEEYILNGKYNQLKEKFFVEVKTWTKYVTKSFKTELYRNEKNNMKDTDLMELIGWESPITTLIYEQTKTDLARKALSEMYTFDERILYQDRELVVDTYSLYCNRYGDKNWIKQQFENGLKIQKIGKVSFDKVWELFLNVMYFYKTNNQKVKDSQTWRMLVFYSCLKYLNSPLVLSTKGRILHEKLYSILLSVHTELDDKSIYYGWKSGGDIPLNFKELKSGMKGSSGWFKPDYTKLKPTDSYDESKHGSDYISKKQGEVLLELWNNTFFEFLQEEDGVVIPAKRSFDSSDISYIVKRDSRQVRINGEVYDSNGVPIRFSDIYPEDDFIRKYGTKVDYVTLPLMDVMGTNIQVDHIPPYSKNMTEKDLDKCELTSDTFNNWKNNRESVYESEVLEEIQDRRVDMGLGKFG